MSLNTVPFNPFPPSSAQRGSGEGGYVLPIAADDTLGGIKVGDNLTIEEDGTLNAPDTYTLPIASDDTLGGVKVGGGLSIDAETGVLSADNQIVGYSTSEVNTGEKWIDNKPIYKKTFSFDNTSNAIVEINIAACAVDTMVKTEVVCDLVSNIYYYDNTNYIRTYLTATKEALKVERGSSYPTNANSYVTMYYTKVTT